MTKRIDFEIKEKMVSLSGACFWYWNSFYSFLESCGVSRSVQKRFPKDNKYQVMRHILAHLEERGDIATIENIIASFYRLTNVVDKGVLDEAKAKTLLAEFKTAVGNDPVESEVRRREKARREQDAQERIKEQQNFQDRLKNLNTDFMALSSLQGVTLQERGYRLEKLFFELLRINEIEYSPPYKTSGELDRRTFQIRNV